MDVKLDKSCKCRNLKINNMINVNLGTSIQ